MPFVNDPPSGPSPIPASGQPPIPPGGQPPFTPSGQPPLPPPGGAPKKRKALRLAYYGEGGEVAGIAAKNALLTLGTLGIYRFWGKTRLRRYLWSQVSLMGEPFEYSGTGSELFKGFLIALAILIPLFALSHFVELWAYSGVVLDPNHPYYDPDDVERAAALVGAFNLFYVACIYFLVQFAVYRARRYRLTRTRWRGIRAGQTGAARNYAVKAFLLGLLSLVTLFLAHPYAAVTLQRYRIKNTWLGNQTMTFSGKTGDLFGSWFLAWLFAIPTIGITLVWYKVKEFRYFAQKTGYRSLGFKSDLGTGQVIGIYFLYYFLTLITIVALLIGVGYFGGALEFFASHVQVDDLGHESFDLSFMLGYLIVLLVVMTILSILQATFLTHPMAKAVINSLLIFGDEDIDQILQNPQKTPGRGEGFADVLDVGDIGF